MGATRGYEIQHGQNPNGVKQYNCDYFTPVKFVQPLQDWWMRFVFLPWVVPKAMQIKPLHGWACNTNKRIFITTKYCGAVHL
jgi:hypothetical protein